MEICLLQFFPYIVTAVATKRSDASVAICSYWNLFHTDSKLCHHNTVYNHDKAYFYIFQLSAICKAESLAYNREKSFGGTVITYFDHFNKPQPCSLENLLFRRSPVFYTLFFFCLKSLHVYGRLPLFVGHVWAIEWQSWKQTFLFRDEETWLVTLTSGDIYAIW